MGQLQTWSVFGTRQAFHDVPRGEGEHPRILVGPGMFRFVQPPGYVTFLPSGIVRYNKVSSGPTVSDEVYCNPRLIPLAQLAERYLQDTKDEPSDVRSEQLVGQMMSNHMEDMEDSSFHQLCQGLSNSPTQQDCATDSLDSEEPWWTRPLEQWDVVS